MLANEVAREWSGIRDGQTRELCGFEMALTGIENKG